MNFVISVVGLKETIRDFVSVDRDQVPFARAVALTRTAKDAQGVVQKSLGSRFVLRRASWSRANVRIEPATKTKPYAVVKDTFAPMGLQETGGSKVPMHGSKVAVPLSGVRPWNSRKLIDAQDLPAAVMEQGGFIRGNIMYRVTFKAGRRRGLSKAIGGIQAVGNWSRKVVPMYALVDRANIRPRYGFVDQVRTVVGNFATHFEQAFKEARGKAA
jgi:hypothetical protein